MDSFFHYEMLPTTWFYLSSLMIFALFFRFDRFLSIRNLDLVALILLMGGFLLIAVDLDEKAGWGYFWMFSIGVFLALRLLLDPLMVRRPLLEPNLSFQGMLCAGSFLLIFLIGGLIVGSRPIDELGGMIRVDQAITIQRWTTPRDSEKPIRTEPGYAPFLALSEAVNIALAPSHTTLADAEAPPTTPSASTNKQGLHGFTTEIATLAHEEQPVAQEAPMLSVEQLLRPYDPFTLTSMSASPQTDGPDGETPRTTPLPPEYQPGPPVLEIVPRAGGDFQASGFVSDPENAEGVQLSVPESGFWMDIIAPVFSSFSQFAIAFGMIMIAFWHFDSLKTGVAAATLYLLLPYTNQMPGRLDHIVPAAMLVWAVVFYRMPLLSGSLLGVASGLAFFPIFCFPLWIGFYWRRGLYRFLSAGSGMLVLMVLLLLLSPERFGSFGDQCLRMFGAGSLSVQSMHGFWTEETQWYRLPVFAVFLVVCIGLTFWPAQKHLGALICLTSAIMIGAGFWQVSEGGLYMAWYLPLLIMTTFRPNLEDRIAEFAVRGGPGL